MANKDFGGWTEIKLNLQTRPSHRFFYEREVWWTAIGHNLGSEEDGKKVDYSRPVLVLRKFNRQLFWGIPLTTIDRTGRYYVSFKYTDKISVAMLSQLRAYDSRRLLKRDGVVSETDFARIQLGLVNILRTEPQK